MRRRALAVGALLALVALTGCLGGGTPSPEELNENASYDWSEAGETDARLTLEGSSYTAIYRLENRSEFEVYVRDALGTENAVPIRALRYRAPDGSVATVGNSSMSVETRDRRTVVDLPGNVSGQVAYTAPRNGKGFSVPTFVTGSYVVTLPPDARVGIPLLSQADPGGWSSEVTDGRMTVTWGEVESDAIRLRWYLQRDILIFSVLAVGLVVVGGGGVLYYYRQIRQLERRREEVGLDVDTEDDDVGDGGPPPGMR